MGEAVLLLLMQQCSCKPSKNEGFLSAKRLKKPRNIYPLRFYVKWPFFTGIVVIPRLGVPQHYLLALRQVSPLEHSSLQQEGSTYTTGHIEHVARTFAVSYEQLNPEVPIDATALQLLAHVTCFAPGEPIPRDLLRRTMGPEEDDEREDRFVKVVKRVHALGLLNTYQDGAQQMHRLLVAFVQGSIASTATAREVQTTVEQVVRDFAWEVNRGGRAKIPAKLAHNA